MKRGVLVDCYCLPIEDGIRRAAQDGADGIQLYLRDDMLENPQRMAELKAIADGCCIEIAAFVAELGGHGFQIAEENIAKLEKMKKVFALAGKLGAIVTGHIGVIPADEHSATYDTMLHALNVIGKNALDEGTVFAIETGPEIPETLLGMLKRTQGGVGVNFDPANLLMVLGVNAVHGVEVLKDYIYFTHAKDGVHCRDCDPVAVYDAFARGGFDQLQAETGTLFEEAVLGQGAVDFPRYLATLKRTGYDGYLTIEREAGDTRVEDIAYSLAYLKEQLALLK